MKNILTLTVLLLSSLSYSQQEAQFTQYNDNMMYYNPGYTGSREALNITAIHRQQWLGFEGAPMSTALFLHSPLRYESVGLGFSVLNDRVGPLNSTWINGNFAYTFKINKKNDAKLSFGLKGGVNLVNADFGSLYHVDDNDQTVDVSLQNEVLPNFGAGIYYHTKYWYAGVSIPRFIESGNQVFSRVNTQRHAYVMVGGYVPVNRMLKIRPSALFKMTQDAPFALDGSVAFIFYDKLWLGANYRLNESIGGLFQIQASDQFKIGMSADFSTSKLVKYNAGTYELLLSYDFMFKGKRVVSPRYF